MLRLIIKPARPSRVQATGITIGNHAYFAANTCDIGRTDSRSLVYAGGTPALPGIRGYTFGDVFAEIILLIFL